MPRPRTWEMGRLSFLLCSSLPLVKTFLFPEGTALPQAHEATDHSDSNVGWAQLGVRGPGRADLSPPWRTHQNATAGCSCHPTVGKPRQTGRWRDIQEESTPTCRKYNSKKIKTQFKMGKHLNTDITKEHTRIRQALDVRHLGNASDNHSETSVFIY